MIKKVRIAVDHGNRNMKTCSQVFTTGLTIQDKKPARGEKFLFYEGKYYVLSENRIPYQRDKTQDDRFFILTLFAIVKELEENPLIQPEDVIQVDLPIGLPPKHYAELCERYESYFKRQGKIHDINYCGSTYHITIGEVMAFPQDYAAMMTMIEKLQQIPKVVDCKWKGQEYSKDAFGFTHAEYVCSFILKENPEAEIVLVPIVRKNKKSTVLDMIEGIELLIEEQVDIINMSMGDEYKYHKEIEEVCRAATEKGILIVAAYSNQQVEATYPASFPFVMGIRCLDIENPLQVFQYDGIGKDVIFSSKFFSLYHLGIPKFYQGNSFGCAVITGYLSNYEDEYEQAILQFTLNTLNHYYPYQTLKQKQCYFLTNRIEEPLEQRFIREVTRTERCDTFESGMEKLRNIKTAEQYPVLFIDHNNYQEICEYKERIRVYAMENPKTEIILRYPLFNMVERLDFQKKTNRNLNQFTV